MQQENATSFMHYMMESAESGKSVVRSTLTVSGKYWSGVNQAGRQVFFVIPENLNHDSIITPQPDPEDAVKKSNSR